MVTELDTQTSGFISQPGLAAIRVSGSDAGDFLQAQLSNDVLKLDRSHSALAAWCDPKGRVLAVLRIVRRADDYLLLVPDELSQALVKRLRMFVLRLKVEISDPGNTLRACALFGADADTQMSEFSARLTPSEAGELACLWLPGTTPCCLITGAADAVEQLATHFADTTVANGRQSWLLNRICAGEPQVYAQTQGAFVPQMLNLHWLGGIDFKKGCYPGQEVVARLQYRGTLTRRMFLARVGSAHTPAPGEMITGLENASIGQVVAAAPAAANEQRLLAVLKVNAEIQHANLGGAPLELLNMPYDTTGKTPNATA